MAGSGRIGAHDDQILKALLEGASQREAADRVGVSERTVRRRVADPGFQRRLQEAQAEILKRMQRRVVASAIRAVGTLDEIAQDAEQAAMVRVNAARTLLTAATAQQPSKVELTTAAGDEQDSAIAKLRALLSETRQNRAESDDAVASTTNGNGANGHG